MNGIIFDDKIIKTVKVVVKKWMRCYYYIICINNGLL